MNFEEEIREKIKVAAKTRVLITFLLKAFFIRKL
jgi:hypothetical protein